MKNLISLHEAVVLALIKSEKRIASFEEIAQFIENRNLYPIRNGNIELAKQIMLRTTQSKSAYKHLFEQIDNNTIRLRNL